MNPIRSMTGFAQVRRQTSAGELTVSLRSVNHKGLDLHFHQSYEFAQFENGVRAVLKEQVARGHLEIRVSLARAEAGGGFYNSEALKRYADAFRRAATELKLDDRPDLNMLLTMPGVLNNGNGDATAIDDSFEPELMAGVEACARNLNEFREREGGELAAAIANELAEIERATCEIKAIQSQALPYLRKRLHERLSELLGTSFISEARLAEEAALLADRADVQEELTRLTVHTQELGRMLGGGGQVGKRLDFLLQEMNRETNTTLAKTSGAGEPGLKITNLALAVKANIERIREQALNLE